MHTHKPARRDFLKLSTRLATLGLTGVGLGSSRSLFVSEAFAASPVNDYKALVCVYLFGGNDNNNTVVPIDTTRYAQYAALRSFLTLPASQLTALNADYALHSSLAPLQPLFAANHMAVVLNTGQLERPLTKTQYQQGLLRPSNLFSHSDQTIQAQTATSNNTIGGWGGRLLDAFGAADSLAAVSVSSPATWLQSGGGAPNVIPPGASLNLSGMTGFATTAAQTARQQAVNAMLALDGGHPLRAAANDAFADGLQLAAALNGAGTVSNLQTVFPGTGLGNQMREVMRLIRLRAQIGPGRQVFFCSMGGYDTHTGQAGSHGNLLAELGGALRAFHDATLETGLMNQITAFTQSEFGRTMEPNGSGTDHAWGAHQFVIGGAVRGGIYGTYPVLALSGPDDVTDRGVWLPTIGTSQFGATLGRWFGASPGELAIAFPNLSTFATSDVGFML